MSFHPLRAADEKCPGCGGLGYQEQGDPDVPGGLQRMRCDCENGTRGEPCNCCNGIGRRTSNGPKVAEEDCEACNGTGRIPGDPDAPKVIEVEEVDARWVPLNAAAGRKDRGFVWRRTSSSLWHGEGEDDVAFDTPELALDDAREVLSSDPARTNGRA